MGQAIGRTFKVTRKQVSSYEPTTAPRRRARMKANPIGVTTLAQVNGRGAASARAAARGKTRTQQLSRARELLGGNSSMKKNRSRAAFVKKATKKVKMTANAQKVAGKRLSAYNAARKRGMSEKSAGRSALRKTPFTANERARGVTFKGAKARRLKANRSSSVGGGNDAYAAGWEAAFGGGSSSGSSPTGPTKKKRAKVAGKKKTSGAKKAKKKTTKKRKATRPVQFRTVKSTVKRKKRVAYGQFKRAKLYNPRTGKHEYSYMYRTKTGKLRRIPTDAVLSDASGESSSVKAKQKMDAARKRAAERILKEGGAFVPNAKRTRAMQRRKYFNKLVKEGSTQTAARAAALSKFPPTSKEAARGYKFSTAKKRKKTKGGGANKTTAKRKTTKRKAKKTTAKRKTTKRKAKKTTAKRKTKGSAKRKKKGAGRRNARTMTFTMRANGRGRYTMNSFMSDMKMVLKSGALIVTGFVTHRVLTSLAAEYLLAPMISPEGAEPNLALKKWEKPIAGAVVAGIGIAATGAAIKGPERVMIGGGMLASWLQSVIVSALMAADQPQVASRLEGYSNSMAYQLRGRRRRGMGAMTTIMPRYAPLSGFQQAAAGFQQASAGGSMGRRGAGEYFTGTAGFMQAAAGTGEYFAAPSLKGVGGYEPAGPLVMQASAGVGQKPIDDGIRPDSNLDQVLDLAESAAGLGEYLTAQQDNGGWSEDRVPTQSQWVPNGPLWAGELKAKGNIESSELPAGILAMPGGNGVLS